MHRTPLFLYWPNGICSAVVGIMVSSKNMLEIAIQFLHLIAINLIVHTQNMDNYNSQTTVSNSQFSSLSLIYQILFSFLSKLSNVDHVNVIWYIQNSDTSLSLITFSPTNKNYKPQNTNFIINKVNYIIYFNL